MPSLGAGEETKGDAFAVFPAGTRREPAPAEPKQTNKQANKQADLEPGTLEPVNAEAATDAASFVIELAAAKSRIVEQAESTAGTRAAEGLVTVRPKPEKRKNARERAKEKFSKKTTQKSAEGGTTPDTTAKAKSKADKQEKTKKAKFGR